MAEYRHRQRRLCARTRPSFSVMLHWLAAADLPPDVRNCECSEVILFKASVFLNFLTFGDPSMTFSARCHLSRRTARHPLRRLVWSFMTAFIDTACACLRGESEHCATAWTNYVKRDPADRNLVFRSGEAEGGLFDVSDLAQGGTTA